MRRSIRRCSLTARSFTCRPGCAARWSSRPISASTRRIPGSSSARSSLPTRGSYVSYLEGCTAPKRDENQLHAAVVELVTLDEAGLIFRAQELVSGRRPGSRGYLIISSPSGAIAAARGQKSPGPGRDWLRDHLEISVLHIAWRGLARRILFDRDFERPPAGRQRNEDDPSRPQHHEPHHFEGRRRREVAEHLSGAGWRTGWPPERAISPSVILCC